MSHPVPVAALQTVAADLNWSVGQLLFVPSQLSETSHWSTAALHSAVDFMSVGQSLLTPLHDSATSQTPAAPLH